MWIIVGCAPLLGGIAGGGYLVSKNPNPPGGWLTVLLTDGLLLSCPCCATTLASFGLIHLGLRFTAGRARDTLVMGTVSIVLGALTAAPAALALGYYLFARLATLQPTNEDHRSVIAVHAREGWRLIQLIEPGYVAWVLLGSQLLGELIFERPVASGAADAEPGRATDGGG
jgi:hypothetical protein